MAAFFRRQKDHLVKDLHGANEYKDGQEDGQTNGANSGSEQEKQGGPPEPFVHHFSS